ncbi:trypsin epsilon-like [Anoplophora glabripennis]|uniref:trypsin epsilon-like n=1 Tax=Anoplophora glabripennis TaxID=217634 RepID=UPI000874EF02|nr:trypsin epsilon-like [Anoplophora glabripennis]
MASQDRESSRDNRHTPMSQISCITVTTLIVVSLANLILLLTIVLESMKKCNQNVFDMSEHLRNRPGKSLMSLVAGRAQDETTEHKHMAALCLIKYNRVLLICGTTIISKFWVLTAAHCCELVKSYPLEKVKISSNSAKWRNGVAHDVEAIMRHANYSQRTVSHNLCLVKVKTPFVDSLEVPIALAGSRYKYIANTTATTMGWSSKNGVYESDQLYSSKVTLVPFSTCKGINNLNIDDTMVCAWNQAKLDCSYDSGGPLFQNNLVIGIVSFETDCASGDYPRVYTRISYFEKWIGHVEEVRKEKIGARFKSSDKKYIVVLKEVYRVQRYVYSLTRVSADSHVTKVVSF